MTSLLFLFFQLGYAGTLDVAPVQGEPSESPFGPVSARTALALFNAPTVRIGRVTEVTSWWKVLPNGWSGYRTLYSTLVFRLEASLRGEREKKYTIDVTGGMWEGQQMHTTKYEPQPVVGHRYLVATHRLKSQSSSWPVGQPIIEATLTIDPKLTLPSEHTLRTKLETWCQTP